MDNLTKLSKNSFTLLVLYILLCPFAFVEQTPVLFYIGCLFLVSSTLSKKVGTIFDRMLIVTICSFAFNTLVGALAWVVDKPIVTHYWLILYAAITAAFVIGHVTKKVPIVDERPPLSLHRLLPMILCLLTFLIITMSFIGKIRTNYVYQFIGFGGDNVSHIDITNVVNTNKGYVYRENIITNGQTSYPQGMHLNISVLRTFIEKAQPQLDSIRGRSVTYVMLTAGFFSMFVYMGLLVARLFVPNSRQGLLAFIAIGTLLMTGPVFDFYVFGFQTHIFTLIMLLSQIYLLALFGDWNSKNIKTRNISYVTCLLLNVGLSFSWLFILPVSLGMLGFVMLKSFIADYQNDRLAQNTLKWFPAYIAIAAVSLIQIYVQLTYNSKKDALNETGFIEPVHTLYLLVFVLSCAILAFWNKRKHIAFTLQVLLIAILASTSFALVIYIYQMSQLGHLEYYFYKAAYNTIVIGLLVTPVTLLVLYNKLDIKKSKAIRYLLVTGSIWIVAVQISPLFKFVYQGQLQGLNPSLANSIGSYLDRNPSPKEPLISIGSCNRSYDYLATRLAGVLTGNNQDTFQSVAFVQLRDDRDDVIKTISRYSKSKEMKLTIVDNSGGKYRELLGSKIPSNSHYLVPTNDAPRRTPTTCPQQLPNN